VALNTVEGPMYTTERVIRFYPMIPFVKRHIFPRKSSMTIPAMSPQPELVAVVIPTIPMADFTS
jgi:hypothetical protein